MTFVDYLCMSAFVIVAIVAAGVVLAAVESMGED